MLCVEAMKLAAVLRVSDLFSGRSASSDQVKILVALLCVSSTVADNLLVQIPKEACRTAA